MTEQHYNLQDLIAIIRNSRISDVEGVIEQAETEIQGVTILSFSPSAVSSLETSIRDYISELVLESIKSSKRDNVDVVSAKHVDRAHEYLVSSSQRRLFRHLGTVGGIILGAGLSNTLALVTANTFSATGVLLSVGLGLIGSFLVAFHIAKE